MPALPARHNCCLPSPAPSGSAPVRRKAVPSAAPQGFLPSRCSRRKAPPSSSLRMWASPAFPRKGCCNCCKSGWCSPCLFRSRSSSSACSAAPSPAAPFPACCLRSLSPPHNPCSGRSSRIARKWNLPSRPSLCRSLPLSAVCRLPPCRCLRRRMLFSEPLRSAQCKARYRCSPP